MKNRDPLGVRASCRPGPRPCCRACRVACPRTRTDRARAACRHYGYLDEPAHEGRSLRLIVTPQRHRRDPSMDRPMAAKHRHANRQPGCRGNLALVGVHENRDAMWQGREIPGCPNLNPDWRLIRADPRLPPRHCCDRDDHHDLAIAKTNVMVPSRESRSRMVPWRMAAHLKTVARQLVVLTTVAPPMLTGAVCYFRLDLLCAEPLRKSQPPPMKTAGAPTAWAVRHQCPIADPPGLNPTGSRTFRRSNDPPDASPYFRLAELRRLNRDDQAHRTCGRRLSDRLHGTDPRHQPDSQPHLPERVASLSSQRAPTPSSALAVETDDPAQDSQPEKANRATRSGDPV
jgi:hypothetical protein